MVKEPHQVDVESQRCHDVVFRVCGTSFENHLQVKDDVDARYEHASATCPNQIRLRSVEKVNENGDDKLEHDRDTQSDYEIHIHPWTILDRRSVHSCAEKARCDQSEAAHHDEH